MSEGSDGDEYMDVEDVPDDALILQCGRVVSAGDGVIGRINIDQFKDLDTNTVEDDS